MIDISKCKNEEEIKEAYKYEDLKLDYERTQCRLEKTLNTIYELNVHRIKLISKRDALISERDALLKKLDSFENKDYVVNEEYHKQKHTE